MHSGLRYLAGAVCCATLRCSDELLFAECDDRTVHQVAELLEVAVSESSDVFLDASSGEFFDVYSDEFFESVDPMSHAGQGCSG